MIKYKLICKECNIFFDSWFSSSKKLKKKKFLNCYICDSANVEKTIMSPTVFTSNSKNKIDIQDKQIAYHAYSFGVGKGVKEIQMSQFGLSSYNHNVEKLIVSAHN